ncbi:MAG: SH3 domain-containing protein [Chloroflexi bacterium]|nr:SH3 domain-containing protein [Chloroflexota bacterium]
MTSVPQVSENHNTLSRYRSTVETLHVRESPGTNNKSLGYLQRNDIVEVLSSNVDGTWLQVRRERDGLTGWCSAAYIELIGASSTQLSAKNPGFEIPSIRYNVPEPTSYTGTHIIRLGLPIHYFSKQLAPDYALEFSNGNSVAVTLESASFEKGLTMEVWLKRTRETRVPPNIGFGLRIDLSGRLSYPYNTGDSIQQSKVLEIGQWYHIAMTVNPNPAEVVLYLNGEKTWSGSSIIWPPTKTIYQNQIFYLGGGSRDLGAGDFFEGQMDEFRLWNTLRTADEIQQNTSGNVSGQNGLNCYWRFNEGTGNIIKDLSGNNNDGTVYGAQWIASTRPVGTAGIDTAVPLSTDNELKEAYQKARDQGVFDEKYFPGSGWISSEKDKETARKALPLEDMFVKNYQTGLMMTYYRTIGGELAYRFVSADVGENQPALYLIERYRLSSYLGAYGAGRTIGTYSLLPGENTKISISSYRSVKETSDSASSILDSYTSDSANSFESSLNSERAAGSSRKASSAYQHDQALSAEAGGSAEASWGVGSAEIHASVQTSISDSSSSATESNREEFAKNVSNAVSKHAAAASSKRDVSISARTEKTTEQQDTNVVERTIENFTKNHTLNFIFRQMNQEFYTILHLMDMRVAASGQAPVTLPDLDKLLEASLKEEFRETVKTFIENELSRIRDHQGNLQPDFLRKHTLADGVNDQPLTYLSINRQHTSSYVDPVTDQAFEVPGIIVNVDKVTMRTDGIMVESVLGQGQALDEFSVRMQRAEAEARELDNQIRTMQLNILRSGDKERAGLYAQLFSNNDHS